MKLINLYIGSDNITKEVNLNLIENFLNKYFDGYALFKNDGYYKGLKESSVKIEILTDITKTKLFNLIKELKVLLNQNSILLTIDKPKVEFI